MWRRKRRRRRQSQSETLERSGFNQKSCFMCLAARNPAAGFLLQIYNWELVLQALVKQRKVPAEHYFITRWTYTCTYIRASLHTLCMYKHTHTWTHIHVLLPPECTRAVYSHTCMYLCIYTVDENTIFTHIFCERVEGCFHIIDMYYLTCWL